jgi:AcrR family transcriptional regulator
LTGSAGGGGKRRGRRPGPSGTREAILAAARDRFTSQGYDRTSLREIAADAGVDPALIHHYFRDKAALFLGAMRVPDLELALGQALAPAGGAADPEQIGPRLLRAAALLWGDPELPRTLAGLLRTAATNEQGTAMLREFLGHAVLSRIAKALPSPDAELRASLVGSQIFGLLMARVVLRLEPLASLPVEDLVRVIGPTLQRYLTGDIGTGSSD